MEDDPCNPSPCGPNAQCKSGQCTCLPEYQGDPYRGCRPECVLNNDCPRNRACVRNKCIDPCPGTCGQNAECTVINHVATCSCIQGFIGNAFVQCNPIPGNSNSINFSKILEYQSKFHFQYLSPRTLVTHRLVDLTVSVGIMGNKLYVLVCQAI